MVSISRSCYSSLNLSRSPPCMLHQLSHTAQIVSVSASRNWHHCQMGQYSQSGRILYLDAFTCYQRVSALEPHSYLPHNALYPSDFFIPALLHWTLCLLFFFTLSWDRHKDTEIYCGWQGVLVYMFRNQRTLLRGQEEAEKWQWSNSEELNPAIWISEMLDCDFFLCVWPRTTSSQAIVKKKEEKLRFPSMSALQWLAHRRLLHFHSSVTAWVGSRGNFVVP